MARPIDMSKRYLADDPCPNDGTYERYRRSGHCCACISRWNAGICLADLDETKTRWPRKGAEHKKLPDPEPVRAAHPHVIESDWLQPIPLSRLMARR